MIKWFMTIMESLDKFPSELQAFEALIWWVKVWGSHWQIHDISKDDYIQKRNEKAKYRLDSRNEVKQIEIWKVKGYIYVREFIIELLK